MFIYIQWEEFCRKLKEKKFISIPAAIVLSERENNKQSTKQYIILKHDVEANLQKALMLAQIENKYLHKGSFYVQAYLLHHKKNIDILKQIQELGHEVTYHHDVMDSNKGDIVKATVEFQNNIEMFKHNGFSVKTVCQHGNPVIERVGYSSNRDFFRDVSIAKRYEHMTEMMVNFKSRLGKSYHYISDSGYGWKIIFDPENNDVVKSNDKDTQLENLGDVIKLLKSGNSVIVSTHPHRWHSNIVVAQIINILFKAIRIITIFLLKIPFMTKFMGRFYYLAKKI
ncbi:MAG: hypothetical protein H6Q69_860 [Firmicutes bacterium]|nr:hypothetical protein [Bacillota bacterium]